MSHLLIIGGSDAGISAALRARELRPETEVTMVLADRFPNFSICGLPFFLSGEVGDWRNLAHRTAEDIEREGIRVMTDTRAVSIDPIRKTVGARDASGRDIRLSYDKLVIGTGAVSAIPPLPGMDHPGVLPLRWMADAFAFRERLERGSARSLVIVGAGYIGMEMADAMTHLGLEVTVMEAAPSVLTTLDPELAGHVRAELERNGVRVITGVGISAVRDAGGRPCVLGADGSETVADLVLAATGGRPQTALARSIGLETGVNGAIRVNRRMETALPDIYAAGDCVETWHRLLERYTYLPLGTTAHKQGRVAGENAVGGDREFVGSLGTQSVKIFGLVAARTGLKDQEAVAAGFDPLSVDLETWDHKAYYPGARKLWLRITGDRATRRFLGLQMVGAHGAEISKRIDIAATAIFHGMPLDAVSDLDLSYTPPLSSPWDPVQMAAQAWERKLPVKGTVS